MKNVVISIEDSRLAAAFWSKHNIPMPPELRAAFDNFANDQTFSNQDEMRFQVCRAIVNSGLEIFARMTVHPSIVEECRVIVETCPKRGDKEVV